jgi:hypothetical protein
MATTHSTRERKAPTLKASGPSSAGGNLRHEPLQSWWRRFIGGRKIKMESGDASAIRPIWDLGADPPEDD